MCRQLNIINVDTIKFADTQVLLCDVKISESFKEQAELLRTASLSGVGFMSTCGLMNRRRQDVG